MAYVNLNSLIDRQALDIFPFNASELVGHWFLTLGDQLKTNMDVFKEAFFKRFRDDGCQSDLDVVKQEDQESVDNFIHLFQLADCDLDLSEKHLVSRLERGLMLTSSSSSVNLSETIQATVNAAMIQMVMNNTGDHATVARYDIYCC